MIVTDATRSSNKNSKKRAGYTNDESAAQNDFDGNSPQAQARHGRNARGTNNEDLLLISATSLSRLTRQNQDDAGENAMMRAPIAVLERNPFVLNDRG